MATYPFFFFSFFFHDWVSTWKQFLKTNFFQSTLFWIKFWISFVLDIPLLPSITSLSLGENEEKSGPFVVHWLNNKELHFTLSMEVFLQQVKKNFEHHSPETNAEESNPMDVRSEEGKSHIRNEWLSFYNIICNILSSGLWGMQFNT